MRLLFPPKAVLILLPVISFSALIYIFAADMAYGAAAYAVYCFSAYSLTIIAAAAVRYGAAVKSAVKNNSLVKAVMSHPAVRKYRNDISFRGGVGIYQGMAVNFLYVVFRAVTAVIYSSEWFMAMAVYHFVLGCMRGVLVYGYRHMNGRGKRYELRFYRAAAYMLFLLNIPMGYMILLTVRTDTSTVYSQYVIYLSALFTFCTMIISVMNLIKYRRAGSPILSAAKVINFTAAMMSLLGLQTAMISCFSEDSEHFRRIMTGITGGCVYGIVIITALIMLIRCRRASADE